MQHLIGHNPKLMLCKDSEERTPLHAACQRGQTEVVTQHKSVEIIKLLLNKGGSEAIELKDDHRCTPLHHAARNNQPEMITFLHQR